MKKLQLSLLLTFAFCIQLHAQILFSETFSTSLGQCVATNSASGTWTFANSCSYSSSGGHSASGHAIFNGSSCQFGNGGSTVSGDLVTPTISIGPSGAVLTFNYRLVNECGSSNSTCSYDVLTLMISNNGGSTWTSIMASNGSPSGLTNNSAWTAVSYSLNSYSNQTIIIRFNFNSIDGVANAYDGVYIDDIIVTGNCFINLTSVGGSTVSPLICSGNNLTLTTNAVSNYSWSTGATTPSIVVSPTVNTMYSVIGTSSANCVSSASLNVQVNSGLPSLSVANTASATNGSCPNASVTLTASGANTYTWNTSGPIVTNGVPFVPNSAATYTCIGQNACGTSSVALSLSLHPAPTVTAIASTPSVCSGVSATLTGIGNAASYNWIGGAGGITNGVGFFPPASANYTCIGTSANTCTSSATASILVVTTPSIPPTANPALICIGNSSTLTAIGATNYTWLPGNSSASSIVVSPTSPINTYTVTRSSANCVTTQTLNVIVNQLPTVFAIATPTLVCAGKPSTLAVGGAQTYTWTAPGPPSYTFTGASPVVSPQSNTTYTVAAHDGTCVNTTTVAVATDPNPTLMIAATNTNICAGQSVTLTASGGINYTWTANSTNSATGTSYSDTPSGPTLFSLIGDNSFGCTSTISQIVLVNPNPTITIATSKTLVCSGGPSTITASGANTYVWDANAGGATTAGTIVNPINTTVYTVTGTYASTGCNSTKTVEVKVFTPTITVTNPTNTCYGGNITLVASGANPGTYNWNTGSGFTNPFQTIAVTPTVFTIYTVSAISGSNGVNCPSTQTTSIGIFYNPTITAVPERTFFCRGEQLNIVGNGGVSYVWSNSQTGGTITVSPNTNTNYTVTGTDANGCVSTGTVQVKVSGCVGINELGAAGAGLSIYPNPNNGEFRILSDNKASLILINEIGQTIRYIELNDSNNFKVDVSELTKGLYILKGVVDSNTISQKILVN